MFRAGSESPLAYRDFSLLWFGHFVSQVGSQMQAVAVAWQVYELSHDPLALGAIGLVRVLPVVLLGLFGGMIADAVDRRRLLIWTQSVMMLTSLALYLLTVTGKASVPALYGLCLVAGAAVALNNPARQAIIPQLVPEHLLGQALSLGITTWQLATVLGPSLGGIVIATFGPGLVYLLDASSFVAMLVALMAMRHRSEARSTVRLSLAAIHEGIAFLRRTPILLSLMMLDFLGTFFAGALLLLPIFAKELLNVGPGGLGMLFAAPSVGAMLAAGLVSLTGPPPLAGSTVIWCVVLYGLATAGFGAAGSFSVAVLCLAISGAADAVSTVVRQTLRQILTPDELRGRMTGVSMIFFMGGPQLGELEAGALARLVGARASVISGGIACVLSALAFAALVPRLRRYRLGRTARS